MTDKERLEKAGWRRYYYKKQGCIRIARWMDPGTPDVYNQTTAMQILRLRNKQRRIAAKLAEATIQP